MFGWLAPTAIWEAIFGPADAAKMKENFEAMKGHLEQLMKEKVETERRHATETEDLNVKIKLLQEDNSVKDKQLEITIKKANKRQQRISGLKKIIEEMAAKINLLEERVLDALHEKDALEQLLEKSQAELAEQRKKWATLEKMELTPEKAVELIQKGESAKEYAVFEETGSLEEDICKLQSILIVKLKEYKAFGNCETPNDTENATGTMLEKRPHSSSCGNHEECKLEPDMEVYHKRKSSEDYKFVPEFKEVHELLKMVECPFKTQVKVMQGLIDEYKGKMVVLEKKERVLEKIMNTSVYCFVLQLPKTATTKK